ncbi:MAG: glycosyltransferase family 4 protein [Chloroflexota bacterium]
MKVAFVTPWYGPDLPGGAETEVRQTAEHLARAGLEVEVLTTCIKDLYADWGRNDHRPGVEVINGVVVRRFPVGKRDRTAFDQVNWRLMNNLPITAGQEKTYIEEMFRVPALYEYIEGHKEEYVFFFIPYLFATTYYGAQICPERSWIIPCLHDESYARLGLYRKVLPRVRGLVLNAEAERQLVAKFFGQDDRQRRVVVGMGVGTDFPYDAGRFRRKYNLDAPFVLYAGRREGGKNTPLLLDYWRRYGRPDVKLVLIGSGEVVVPAGLEDRVVDLGFVSLQDKYDTYAAATVLCQPSLHESFSIVIMESWLTGRPVLVHGDCAVTREHCQEANGGLYFTDYEEFAATLDYLLDHPATADLMGRQGRQYVLANFRWEVIVERYKRLIEM